MTIEAAKDALGRAAEGIAEVSEESVGLLKWHKDYVEPLSHELLETEPFSPLANAWLAFPDGGGVAADRRVASWALQRLSDGSPPDEIIESARDEIAKNVCQVLEVWAVFGADIEKPVQIAEGTRLLPAAAVHADWRSQIVQRPLNPGPFDWSECCVLVQEVTVAPAFRPRLEVDRGFDTEPKYEKRSRIADLVCAAFLLNGSTAVQVNTRTIVESGSRTLFSTSGMRSASFSQRSPIGTWPFTAAELISTYGALAGFENPEALLRAIDRLGRSRLAHSAADKALDLGIAAEILLMHGSGPSGEIRHKLALRSAWLLGADVDERLAISQCAKVLYNARSTAAHSGTLSDPEKFDATTSDDLVASISRAILKAGRYPNWDLICLGG